MKKYYLAFFVSAFLIIFASYIPHPVYGLIDNFIDNNGEDLCENLKGVQSSIPSGYVRDADGNCFSKFVCDSGKECSWINVSNTSSWGVPASVSAQNFYNDQITKDHLCRLAGYEYNQSNSWATKQGQWDKCNTEYYVLWNSNSWLSKKCDANTYVKEIFCAKTGTTVTPPTGDVEEPIPTVTISADPTSVQAIGTTVLTWDSTDADVCIASGDWSGVKETSGSEETSIFLFGDRTFNIACSGSGGSASDSVSVNMYIVPRAPTIRWTIKSDNVASGATYRMEVFSQDADGDLKEVVIQKNGLNVAYSDGGDGTANFAGIDTSDTNTGGTKNVVYTAWAADDYGHKTEITHTVSVSAAGVISAQSAPTIQWSIFPSGTIASGGQYTVEATAYDADNDLKAIGITKNGGAFVSSGSGDGFSNTAGGSTSDIGPSTVSFTASAVDKAGNNSGNITRTVTIGPAATAITASVSAPSCAVPGTSFTVTGNAQGSGITSNILEKDSNLDDVYGAIASRNNAGATSASISVPVNETSVAYAFRVNVNSGSTYSPVTRVSISSSCDRGLWCSLFPSLCNPIVNPSITPPITPSNEPVVNPPVVPHNNPTPTGSCSVSWNNTNLPSGYVCYSPLGEPPIGAMPATGSKQVPASPSTYTLVCNDLPTTGTQIRVLNVLCPVSNTNTTDPSTNASTGNSCKVGPNRQATLVMGGGNVATLSWPSSCSFIPSWENKPVASPHNTVIPGTGTTLGVLKCGSSEAIISAPCSTAPAAAPDFTLSASSPVKIQVVPTVGGTSKSAVISIGTFAGYNSPVTITVTPPGGVKKAEYSWNSGIFTENPSFTVQNFDSGYPSTSLVLRLTGDMKQTTYPVVITGVGGDGKTHSTSFVLDVSKTEVQFEEN